MAHATLTRLEDAGHLVQLDAPAALTAALVRWLADPAHARD